MPYPDDPALAEMRDLLQKWDATADDKALFLRCYQMMTGNVLEAIRRGEFDDPAWVDGLLHRFADYYFVALKQYQQDPDSAPKVWEVAHAATDDDRLMALQKLLLGVNAHINYDLVLTLGDVLRDEWSHHSEDQRESRYTDHCRINDIIGRTVDAVQDAVIEPAMPALAVFDTLLGPLDELIILRLIAHWREKVWRNTAALLALDDAEDVARFILQIEEDALATGRLIGLRAIGPDRR